MPTNPFRGNWTGKCKKNHPAVVTGTDLDHEGSITIDRDLLDQAHLYEYELVQVDNINNGSRFKTYMLQGEPGSGIVELNGAAARLVCEGDRIIIMSYIQADEPLPHKWQPTILLVNDQNQVEEIQC